MGCGASSIYNEDGSIVAGKVAVKFELADTKTSVYFTFADTNAKNVDCLTKILDIPTGLSDIADVAERNGKRPYTKEGVSSAGDNSFWVDTTPGLFAQCYEVSGSAVPSCTAAGAEMPHKLAQVHVTDKEKLPKILLKQVSGDKDKEHRYNNKETGAAAIEEDIAKCKTLRKPHDLPADFGKLKDGLVAVNDNTPMNTVVAAYIGARHIGTWDATAEAPEIVKTLGLSEKVEAKANSILSNTKTQFTVMSKKDMAMEKVVLTIADQVAGQLASKREEFFPVIGAAVTDSAEGRPDQPSLEEFADEVSEKTPEDLDAKEEEIIKKQWAFDKPNLAKWKAADAQPIAERKAAWKKTVDGIVASLNGGIIGAAAGAVSSMLPGFLADKVSSAASYTPKVDEVCLANLGGKGYYEATVISINGATFTVEFPATKKQASLRYDLKATTATKVNKTGVFGEEVEVNVPSFLALPAPVAIDVLCPGLPVRVRRTRENKTFYFCNATVEFVDTEAKSVVVRDRYTDQFTVPADNVWLVTSAERASRRGWSLPQNFVNYNFWWVEGAPAEGAEAPVRELNIWREGAKEESLQTIKMVPTSGKAKPVKKKDAEGKEVIETPTYEVFQGYKANVQLLPYRVYCFNYKIGEDTMLTDDKKAVSKDAYKRFSIKPL